MEEQRENQISTEKLLEELEKIKKRQRFLKIASIVLVIIIFSGFFLVYIVYRKISAYKEILDTTQMVIQKQDTEKLSEDKTNKIPVSDQIVSSSEVQSSSLSMIKFTEDLSETNDEGKKEELKELAEEYKGKQEVQSLLSEMKKDPEIKKLFEEVDTNDPTQVMKKMNDPAVMNKIMKKLISNPKMMAEVMKIAADPKLLNSVNSKKVKKNSNTVEGK